MDYNELSAKKCLSCSNQVSPLNQTQIQFYINLLAKWRLKEDKLEREIKTQDFAQSLSLANRIGRIAEEENHHPDLFVSWGVLRICIFTHSINGLSENDFILAAKLDRLLENAKTSSS